MLDGGADAILVETCQDLLQLKAAVLGSRRAMAQAGRHIPVFAHVTVETTGHDAARQRDRRGADGGRAARCRHDRLNCATGPAEMSEHLRYLSQHARTPVSVMPNAGLPVLGANGAEYPLQPDELAEALSGLRHRVRPVAGRRLLRHHTRTHPPGGRGGPRSAARRATRHRSSPRCRRCTPRYRSRRTRRC